MLLPGNCFIGACLIWLYCAGQMKRTKHGHWYVVTAEAGTWHFTVKHDILPEPCNWLIFLGRFERLRDRPT